MSDGVAVELFTVEDETRLAEALALRCDVFVGEQAVPIEEELDADDRAGSQAVHALAREGGVCIGVGRLLVASRRSARIGRMAVHRSARGRGIGALVLVALIEHARQRGYPRVNLYAQSHAIGFYERYGFAVIGETFFDAGIPHREMELQLKKSHTPQNGVSL